MLFRFSRSISLIATVVAVAGASAQTPAADPSARLREVLPADVADRVLAKIAEARARELPAQALENRALKFASRGVPAAEIEKSINAQAERMQEAKNAISNGRGKPAGDDEIDAGAEAMRKGVDGKGVSELAKSAPSGRSLAVPLAVIGSLVDRGLPSDSALRRVLERMEARASDRELEGMPGNSEEHKPAQTGQDLAATKRPATAGKPATVTRPVSVPANAGKPVAPGAKAPTGVGKKP